jgi:hypothetical protein
LNTVDASVPRDDQERMKPARERIRAVLAPESGPEKSIVDWLGRWDLPTLDLIATMAERAAARARAEGYDKGYGEAGGRP